MPAPLEGIRVLDLCIVQNGGYATVLLGDMGADVVKVEQPGMGDPARNIMPRGRALERGLAPYFEANNRSKRSMTLDLKNPRGREVFYRLVEKADVVATNHKMGIPERLGFDYDSIKKHNPRIIFAHSTGYGRRGPDAHHGVYDPIGLSRSGAMMQLSEPGRPLTYTGSIGIADQVGAMMFAHAIVLALLARERFGVGQRVDLSQLGSSIMFQHLAFYFYTMQEEMPRRTARDDIANPLFNFYEGSDGRWFNISCVQSDKYWHDFCGILGMEEFEHDPRYTNHAARDANGRELVPVIDKTFATKPASEWVRLLNERGLIATMVLDYPEVLEDPQVVANEYFIDFEHPTAGKVKIVGVPIHFSETPGGVQSMGPQFGEHTHEVLLEAGYSWDEISEMIDQKVV